MTSPPAFLMVPMDSQFDLLVHPLRFERTEKDLQRKVRFFTRKTQAAGYTSSNR